MNNLTDQMKENVCPPLLVESARSKEHWLSKRYVSTLAKQEIEPDPEKQPESILTENPIKLESISCNSIDQISISDESISGVGSFEFGIENEDELVHDRVGYPQEEIIEQHMDDTYNENVNDYEQYDPASVGETAVKQLVLAAAEVDVPISRRELNVPSLNTLAQFQEHSSRRLLSSGRFDYAVGEGQENDTYFSSFLDNTPNGHLFTNEAVSYLEILPLKNSVRQLPNRSPSASMSLRSNSSLDDDMFSPLPKVSWSPSKLSNTGSEVVSRHSGFCTIL